MDRRFEQRFGRCQGKLFGYAIAVTGDREVARDLLHDCVARAAAARSVPSEETAFRTWLFTIMRNLWIDQLRTNRVESRVIAQLSEEALCAPVSLESTVVNAFAVRQAFAMLSHDHREVLALIDVSEFSYEEAARILGVPRGTVMSRVSRARQALARLLASDTVVPLAKTGSRKP